MNIIEITSRNKIAPKIQEINQTKRNLVHGHYNLGAKVRKIIEIRSTSFDYFFRPKRVLDLPCTCRRTGEVDIGKNISNEPKPHLSFFWSYFGVRIGPNEDGNPKKGTKMRTNLKSPDYTAVILSAKSARPANPTADIII